MSLIQPLLEPWSGKKPLGNGGHSTVFSAEMPPEHKESTASASPPLSKTTVVVKCIARKDERRSVVENEVQILMHLWPHSDRHIVPYRAAFQDDHCYYIVMQHCPGTVSLTDYLDADIPLPALLDSLPHDSPVIAQKLRTLHIVATNLLLGLERIHAANVAHRDIKPPNVVIKGDDIFFCDFGLAVVDDELLPYHETGDCSGKGHGVYGGPSGGGGGGGGGRRGGGGRDAKEETKRDGDAGAVGAIIGHGEVGSRLFWAPEVSQRKKELRYDLRDWQRADRFSLGMVLWQLATGCDYYEASRRERERLRAAHGSVSSAEEEDVKVFQQAFAHGTDDDRKCHEIYELLAGNTPLPVLEPMGPALARFLEKRAPDYVRVLRALISKTPAHRDTVTHATLQAFWSLPPPPPPLPPPSPSSSSSSSTTSSPLSTTASPTLHCSPPPTSLRSMPTVSYSPPPTSPRSMPSPAPAKATAPTPAKPRAPSSTPALKSLSAPLPPTTDHTLAAVTAKRARTPLSSVPSNTVSSPSPISVVPSQSSSLHASSPQRASTPRSKRVKIQSQ